MAASAEGRLLSFFVRYLNLRDYPEEFYLSMLSFIRYHDNLIDIIPFVASAIGIDRTADQIQANLRAGVSNTKLLSDYVKYLEENQITGSTDILLGYLLRAPNDDQYEMLSAYSKLGGDPEALYPVLDQAKSYFRNRIIEILIRAESPGIKEYLRRLLEIETDPAEHFTIIRYLVRLQDNNAVDLYLKHAAEIGRSPDDSSPGNPLYSLRKLRYTKQIIDLYELAQAPGYYADNFSDLRSIASATLQNIALFPGNFEKFTKLVNEWIKERNRAAKALRQHAPEQVFGDLHFFLETFGKQHETSGVVMPTLDQSLKIYSKVMRKQQ